MNEEKFANEVFELANKCAFPNTMGFNDIPKEHFVKFDLGGLHFGYDKRNIKTHREEIREMEKQLYEIFPEGKSVESVRDMNYKHIPLYKILGVALVTSLNKVEKEEV